MEAAIKYDTSVIKANFEENQKEVRNLVLAGLQQVAEGKTKDFNEVCDRLEKKYS